MSDSARNPDWTGSGPDPNQKCVERRHRERYLEFDIRIDNARLISQVKVRVRSTVSRYWLRVTIWVMMRRGAVGIVYTGTIGDVQVGGK